MTMDSAALPLSYNRRGGPLGFEPRSTDWSVVTPRIQCRNLAIVASTFRVIGSILYRLGISGI